MSKPKMDSEQLNLALYVLKHRVSNPMDLVKYWAFAGPCLEPHPEIEDVNKG